MAGINTSVGRIAVLTVNNCPYCGVPDGKHLRIDCIGDFPRRYREILGEIVELRKRIELLEQESEILTIPILAKRFGITERTIRDAIEAGKLSAQRQGGIWLIRLKDAEKRWGHKFANGEGQI